MNLQTIQKLSIDFNQKGYKTISAKQYDKETRYLVIRCTDNGIFVPLDDTVYANARTLTADGRALLDSTTIQEDGTILLELDDTLLATSGKAMVQIDIHQTNTEKRLTTMNFIINVESSVYGDDTIIASDEFNALNDLIKKATKDYEYVIGESKKHADNAAGSASDAANSASNAAEYATNSQDSATAATQKATAAENSAKAAKTSENNAKVLETNASNSESNAANSAETAVDKANEASNHADMSKSYAVGTNNEVREGDATDNAKKYYEQAKDIAESFAGTLRPKGTITFTNLPSATDAKEGDMYNISDQFTTTASFKEGTGNVIPAGSNVYRTADGFWDVLAGSPVTGVKGASETSYHRGNVSISAANIGLGNVNDTADVDKPVSTAQQAALDAKVNKAGDKMTGDLEVAGTVTAEEFAGNVIGNATSSTRLKTAQNINGISFNGTYNVINYAVCSTEADVPEKTVECSGFSLITGAEITVKFTVSNKAANPALNVNGTGAKPIYYRGAPINNSYLAVNRMYMFKYNGKEYEAVGDIARTNSAQYSGYVSKGEGNEGKVWAVDGNGNPEWSDTINGRISFHKGTSVFASNNNGDFDSGFLKLATFTWKHVSTGYRIPISMKLTKRYGYTPIDISIYFFSNAKESGNTPKLNAWSFDETKTTIYLVSTDNEGLVWELYVNAYPNLNNNFVEISELHVEEQTARYLDIELHQNAYVEEIPESELKAVAEVKNYSKIEAESSDIVKLTKEEYDALPDTKLTDGKIYFISGSGGSGGTSQVIHAGNVIYDNSGSGLSAENVQDAIDELAVEKFDKNGGNLNGQVVITDLSNLTFYNPNGLNTGGVNWTDSKRTIWAAIKADNGTFYIKDDTNNTPILESNLNGTATFRCGNKAELRTDTEGGNLRLTGPSATQFWEMDSWNDTQFRIYHHNHETDQDTFPFTLWQDHIEGMTSGNVPFYKITAENINNPPSPYWNGNYAIGMGVINDIGYLSFKLGWIIIQFHLGNNQIMVRMCYGENGWVDWKTLVLW